MPSNVKEDQAAQLRKHFRKFDENQQPDEKIIDILSLPSRTEKHKKQRKKDKSVHNKAQQLLRKRWIVKFPVVKILLLLFIFLIIFVLAYPNWLEKLINFEFSKIFDLL